MSLKRKTKRKRNIGGAVLHRFAFDLPKLDNHGWVKSHYFQSINRDAAKQMCSSLPGCCNGITSRIWSRRGWEVRNCREHRQQGGKKKPNKTNKQTNPRDPEWLSSRVLSMQRCEIVKHREERREMWRKPRTATRLSAAECGTQITRTLTHKHIKPPHRALRASPRSVL